MFTPMAMIDLLAILPFYLAFWVTDLRFIRILRLLRIFRVIKVVRYSKALYTFGVVAKEKKEELVIVAVLGGIAIFMASALMYFVENEAQPNAFASIPHAMWWAVATLTTVGYGDITPITGLGKFLGAIIALVGIGMFALPAGILGSAFVEEFEIRRGLFKKMSPLPQGYKRQAQRRPRPKKIRYRSVPLTPPSPNGEGISPSDSEA